MRPNHLRSCLSPPSWGFSLFAAAQGMGRSPGDSKGMDMDCEKMGMGAMPMSGNVDRDFAAMMKMHHEGAIRMSQDELQKGKDPQLREMAKKIIEAQKREIAQLDQWLEKSGK